MLTSYQDQEAVVADDLPLPILHSAPYPPAGQPFIEANIEYNNLGMLAVICPYCHALHFDCEKLRLSWVNHPKFGMCCLCKGTLSEAPVTLQYSRAGILSQSDG